MNIIKKNSNMKNSAANAQQIVDKIMTEVYENLVPEPEQQNTIKQILRLLANGSPVKPTEIATHLQISLDKVTSTLKKFGADFDKEGNILGLVLTLVPTSHIYKFNGRKMYTWCAVDALMFPVILQQTAHIESSDPVTGKKIQIHVTPDRVEKIEPKSAVVSLTKNIDITNVRGTICNNVNFFSSPETAAVRIAGHLDMTFYPVNEVYQALKYIHLNRYRDMIVKSDHEDGRMCS